MGEGVTGEGVTGEGVTGEGEHRGGGCRGGSQWGSYKGGVAVGVTGARGRRGEMLFPIHVLPSSSTEFHGAPPTFDCDRCVVLSSQHLRTFRYGRLTLGSACPLAASWSKGCNARRAALTTSQAGRPFFGLTSYNFHTSPEKPHQALREPSTAKLNRSKHNKDACGEDVPGGGGGIRGETSGVKRDA